MAWKIGFTKRAEKFLANGALSKDDIFGLIGMAVRRFRGENANIDIRALKGPWRGFYRIRKGDLRIIASFDFGKSAVHVEAIDWRGNVYR
jgi:mRNA-degrading endonuclease RelE of RelBE toxin-antitoxin system